MKGNKISTKEELYVYLESETWLHRCQLDIKIIDWLDSSSEYNIIKFDHVGEKNSRNISRYIKLGDGRYELNYTILGDNIKEDIDDTTIQVKKLDDVGGCQLAIFSQFGDFEEDVYEEEEEEDVYEEEEEEEEEDLITKKDLSDCLKNNLEEMWSDYLGDELVKWLDGDHKDNILRNKKDGSQEGSKIWNREIFLESGVYLLEYETFGNSIEESECSNNLVYLMFKKK